MRTMQTTILVTSTLFTGLMAGPSGLLVLCDAPVWAGPPTPLIEAMQGVNKAILNPWFMLPFMGTIPLLAAAVWLAWRGDGRSAVPWLVAALVLYLIASVSPAGSTSR